MLTVLDLHVEGRHAHGWILGEIRERASRLIRLVEHTSALHPAPREPPQLRGDPLSVRDVAARQAGRLPIDMNAIVNARSLGKARLLAELGTVALHVGLAEPV